MTHAADARRIQRLAQAARWLRLTIHLSGAAALFVLGWHRGIAAIPIAVALIAPNGIFAWLLFHYGAKPRRYGPYVGLDPVAAAHHIAAVSRARGPGDRKQDALWCLQAYVQNVALSLAVAFAVDASGGPQWLGLAGVAVMMTLTGIANILDFRMRIIDATITFTINAAFVLGWQDPAGEDPPDAR